jgi:hypothetical protein
MGDVPSLAPIAWRGIRIAGERRGSGHGAVFTTKVELDRTYASALLVNARRAISSAARALSGLAMS